MGSSSLFNKHETKVVSLAVGRVESVDLKAVGAGGIEYVYTAGLHGWPCFVAMPAQAF